MDRSTTMGGSLPPGTSTRPASNSALTTKVEDAAQTTHETVDKVTDAASAQVGRFSDTAHRAVNSAADAATSASEWASKLPDQASAMQAKVTEAACTSIRARPITAVVSALVVGYLLGRLARL